MTFGDLLNDLRTRGVRVEPIPGEYRLRFSAPARIVTPEFEALLRDFKPLLFRHFSADPAPDPAELRSAFAAESGVRPCKWSGHNVSRLLRATGERPARVDEMWAILGGLGMGNSIGDCRRWPAPWGVFDHGEMWAREGLPCLIVGHPYQVSCYPGDGRALLAELSRFTSLRVAVDDRPSYYGHGTHHVRIELAEPRRPFAKPRATAKTRAAARAARAAFAEEMGEDPCDSALKLYPDL
jgi:hypothetical protein